MSEEEEQEREEPRPPVSYRLRRAPKFLPFGVTGAVLGVLVGIVLAISFQISGPYSERTIVGYLGAIFGLFGLLAGLGVAVLIDRRS